MQPIAPLSVKQCNARNSAVILCKASKFANDFALHITNQATNQDPPRSFFSIIIRICIKISSTVMTLIITIHVRADPRITAEFLALHCLTDSGALGCKLD